MSSRSVSTLGSDASSVGGDASSVGGDDNPKKLRAKLKKVKQMLAEYELCDDVSVNTAKMEIMEPLKNSETFVQDKIGTAQPLHS